MAQAAVDKLFVHKIELLFISLVVSVLFCYFAWHKRYFTVSNITKSKISFIEMVGGFCIYILLSIAYPYVAEYAFYGLLPKQLQFYLQNFTEYKGWINIFGYCLILLGIVVYVEVLSLSTRKSIWGLRLFDSFKLFIKNIGIGAFSWVLAFPVIVLFSQICALILYAFGLSDTEQLAIQYLKVTMTYPTLFGVLAFCMIIVIPITEEILFRGMLQGWLVRRIGGFWGIIVASIIFAFFHFAPQQKWGNLSIIVPLFIFSCFLGFIYVRQKSLWASIALHATFNGITILLVSILKNG